MADVMTHNAFENDMNAGNAQPSSNALLNGACDDDDNELTEEQKKLIEERLKALQARFKAFEEKTLKQKVDELMMSHEGLTEEQGEMVLRICNNNEFEAADRLSDPEDGEGFMRAVRGMVRLEKRVSKLKGRAAKAAEAKLARRQARLRKRRDIDLGGGGDDDDEEGSDFGEDSEDWSEDDEPETDDEEIVQEVAHGIHFVRHSKKHVTVGRLKLDDALKQLAEAQAKQEADAKAKAEAAEGGGGEGSAEGEACGSEGDGDGEGGAEGNAAAKPPPPAAAAAALEDLMIGWSDARIKAWNGRHKNENAYYYRFNAPGEPQANAKWSDEEHDLFMTTLAKCNGKSGNEPGKADYVWGMFSKNIPGRVGYQCSNYYRTLVKNGTVVDDNYMVDEKGEMRFNFKNKGFERREKVEGGEGGEGGEYVRTVTVKRPAVKKPKKEPAPKRPRPAAAPKKKPSKKKRGDGDDDDKEFRCSVKLDNARRSGRNAGKAKTYTDGGETEEDDFDETPVLPGFMDPLTKMQVEDPAISPYGHVAGYETWCRVLRNLDSKDTCPFTRQPLKRRELVRLTHENLSEYRSKMVETQNGCCHDMT